MHSFPNRDVYIGDGDGKLGKHSMGNGKWTYYYKIVSDIKENGKTMKNNSFEDAKKLTELIYIQKWLIPIKKKLNIFFWSL